MPEVKITLDSTTHRALIALLRNILGNITEQQFVELLLSEGFSTGNDAAGCRRLIAEVILPQIV